MLEKIDNLLTTGLVSMLDEAKFRSPIGSNFVTSVVKLAVGHCQTKVLDLFCRLMPDIYIAICM